MKKLILISALLLVVASNGWAYNETDLAKLRATNACKRCDLSGADLRGANPRSADLRDTYLRGADLSGANLRSADLRGAYLTYADLGNAKYCKTKMPWGEINDDC